MAYTKIHAIKATVDKAIEYICNPDKTDEQIYISSYACAPETAAIDFKYTLDHCRENSPNKAYHLIQAFAPGEVGYEEAHHIGKELADKVLEGKYFSVDTKNLLLSMLYKIENAYKDYEKTKVEVIEKSEFLEKVINIVEQKCNEIITTNDNVDIYDEFFVEKVN